MRKAIFTLVALLSVSACTIDNGTNPSPESAEDAIKACVVKDINKIKSFARYIIVADMVLSSSKSDADFANNSLFGGYNIFVEGNTISFAYENAIEYIVTTDGKTLSEGGVWSLSSRSKDGQIAEEAQFAGIAGQQYTFTCHHSQPREQKEITITHRYRMSTPPARILTVELWGEGYERGYNDSYLIEYSIDQSTPLLYERPSYYNYLSGKTDIRYKETASGKTIEFSTVYDYKD